MCIYIYSSIYFEVCIEGAQRFRTVDNIGTLLLLRRGRRAKAIPGMYLRVAVPNAEDGEIGLYGPSREYSSEISSTLVRLKEIKNHREGLLFVKFLRNHSRWTQGLRDAAAAKGWRVVL